jgi:subtilisin family serine protease
MDGRIERQIQKIVEETPGGDSREVIVRMAGPQQESRPLLQALTRRASNRRLGLSARDALPADRTPEQPATTATPPPFISKDSQALQGSLSVQVTPSMVQRDPQWLRAQALERLQPLVDNERVQRTLETTEGAEPEAAAQDLWASTSLALDVTVNNLRTLPDEIPGIVEIHPNRPLGVPPVAEVHNVPEPVRENRASSWGVHKVGALATWGAYGARGEGIKVGILDTGVDISHPDLQRPDGKSKVVAWAEFDRRGRQISRRLDEAYDEDVGHGTHVAGTVAGGNTSGQWIGVAPEAQLCCAKVLGGRGGSDAAVQAGMAWALDQGVDVICMSLGATPEFGWEMPGTYTTAIVSCLQRGVPVVIAIGNEGAQTTGSPGNDVFALAVGATDYFDHPAGFSGGRTQLISESEFFALENPMTYSKPELTAPGVAVVSSMPRHKWTALNGTSMATPHVAGAIALLLSATNLRDVEPTERGFLIYDLLTGSVEENLPLRESGQNHRYGFGRLEVLRAIGFAYERGLGKT